MENCPEVDEYIARFPEVAEKLRSLRECIRKAAPDAEETISYGMPAFRQTRILVYFAAFKDHISLFPTSSPIVKFRDELKGYKTSKGTIQFPLDRPIPLKLVEKIVKYRLEEANG